MGTTSPCISGVRSMLNPALHRVQTELQCHRRWLHTFLRNTRCPTASACQPFSHKDDRPHAITRRPATCTPTASASFATKSLKIRKHALKVEKERTYDFPVALIRQRDDLRQAVADLRIRDVIRLYRELEDKRAFNKQDFRLVAQCLHHCYRTEQRSSDPVQRREETDELVAFAELLVKDIKSGVVEPNGRAHVHLLGFFKEVGIRDAGLRFWEWLEGQDDRYVNVDVYGAAIELLAVTGTPLAELEDLYQQGLVRFPGNFAAYHLSPEAILPDRDQAVRFPGMPVSLLQGILTARLLHGDTRNAYLALDTALRLYPDQTPTRFFTLFLAERPLDEVYTVFAIACRAGTILPGNQIKKFQSALRQISNLASPARHSLAVRAQLSALYMYKGCGGQWTPNMLNEFTITTTQFLRLAGIHARPVEEKQRVAKEVMDIIRRCITIFARYGVAPGISAINSIITNLGGFGHSKQVIDAALSTARTLNLRPNDVTRRSVLTTAGLLGDADFVSETWTHLREARSAANQHPDSTDWHCFIKAAHGADCIDFARSEFDGLKDVVPGYAHPNILSGFEDSGMYDFSFEESEPLDLPALMAELGSVRADLELVDQRTEDRVPVQDFRGQTLPMTLLPVRRQTVVSEEEMVRLYDELTTEQLPAKSADDARDTNLSPVPNEPTEDLAPPSPYSSEPTAQPTLTQTNIPFGTLRYENWKSLNWLLEQAERSDVTYLTLVDEAIANGTVPPQRTRGLDLGGVDEMGSYGLSDTVGGSSEPGIQERVGEDQVREWGERVRQLRGRVETV